MATKYAPDAIRSGFLFCAGICYYLAIMDALTYTILLEPDTEKGGFVVSVPALPGCLTYGKTYELAMGNAEEAIVCYLDGLVADGEPFPREPHPVVSEVQVTLPSPR
jgi:predicted RNase H-like HicB family nuclease